MGEFAKHCKRNPAKASAGVAGLAVLSVLFSSATWARTDQERNAAPAIQVTVRRVLLRVLVENQHSHRPIRGLKADDFVVKQDGEAQPLTFFESGLTEARPITVVLLLDLRVLNKSRLRDMANSAPTAFAKLNTDDKVSIWTLDQTHYAEFMPAAQDKAAAAGALSRLADTTTKALEAILHSFSSNATSSDLVIVAITDDLDAARSAAVEQIRKGLLAAPGTLDLLYKADKASKFWHGLASVAAPGGFSPTAPGMHYSFFGYLARQTGGQFVEVTENDYAAGLIQALDNIAASYVLEFPPDPKGSKGGFHFVNVALRPGAVANGENARLHYRRAYYEPSASEQNAPAPTEAPAESGH